MIGIAAALVLTTASASSAIQVTVDTNRATQPSFDTRFAGVGWETDAYLYQAGLSQKTEFRQAARNLAPAWLRVGGISADWVNYTGTRPQRPLSWWPTTDSEFSMQTMMDLFDFCNSTGFDLVLDLSELYGRNCSHGAGNTTCTGAWDTSNLKGLLAWLAAHPGAASRGRLRAVELGNELTRGLHITMPQQIEDYRALMGAIGDAWRADPAVAPPVSGPSTDICDGTSLDFMRSVEPLAAFNYHSYPARGCPSAQNYYGQVLSPSWLRRGVWQRDQHANASLCAAQWRSLGLGQRGTALRVTETNSCFAIQGASMSSFANTFWYVASLGQMAQAGVSMHSRWNMASGPFALLLPSTDKGAVITTAADYWVAALHKRTVGRGPVLNASVAGDDDTPVLAYAHCSGSAGQSGAVYAPGAVTLMLVNTNNASEETVSFSGVSSATPRHQWILTAPDGPDGPMYAGNATILNDQASPLALGADGSLPGLAPVVVAHSASMIMPPLSVAFVVLQGATASACMQDAGRG